jgi:hypothetical protein
MPGNPHECRLNAARCSELAESAATPELKRTLMGLAEMWNELAAELESGQPLLKTISELELGPQASDSCGVEPYEALLFALNLRSRAA